MKKIFSFAFICLLGVPLFAHPKTQVVVTRPQTTAVKHMPRTNVVVSRPQTTAQVSHPVTPGSATEAFVNGKPSTDGRPSVAAAKPATSAAPTPSKLAAPAPSYTPSYKQSKDLNVSSGASSQATPKGLPPAAMQANSSLGLNDPNAAQKAADAKSLQFEKVLTEKAAEANVHVPSDFESKIKQLNFAATKGKK